MEAQPAKSLGRFESTYMHTMVAPSPSDYVYERSDGGKHRKTLQNLKMNNVFPSSTGTSGYQIDYCHMEPTFGEKKEYRVPKPSLDYRPSCPEFAPYHTMYADASLVNRRLDTTEPNHIHTWHRDEVLTGVPTMTCRQNQRYPKKKDQLKDTLQPKEPVPRFLIPNSRNHFKMHEKESSAPEPKGKGKTGVMSFFCRGSKKHISENGEIMAISFYKYARRYGGSLLTMAAEKALSSHYL